MSVKRNEDGSVSIQDKNGGAVIGKIIVAPDEKREEKYKQWVENCEKLVKPCAHSIKEVEQYFLQLCDAEPIYPSNYRMRSFKVNIIMNFFKDKLQHQAPQFSFDMADEEIERWHKEERAMHDEAMNLPPEQFGLKMRGYFIPHTEANETFYEQAYKEAEEHMGGERFKYVERQDIYFFLEETTEYWQCNGGGSNLVNKLIVYRGVSEEDIKQRNPRFLGYINALRELGVLTDFLKQ
jgi:hypothetical protein